jgi:hypothetical protein
MNEDNKKPKGLYYLTILLLTGRLAAGIARAIPPVTAQESEVQEAVIKEKELKIQQKADGSLVIKYPDFPENDPESPNLPNIVKGEDGELIAQGNNNNPNNNNPNNNNPNNNENSGNDNGLDQTKPETPFVGDDFGNDINELEGIEEDALQDVIQTLERLGIQVNDDFVVDDALELLDEIDKFNDNDPSNDPNLNQLLQDNTNFYEGGGYF